MRRLRKKCLSILFACEWFDLYVFGRERVFIESDHKPLQVVFNKSFLSAPRRLQRILLKLRKNNLDVRYKTRKEIYSTDTPSRASLPQTGDDGSEMKAEQGFHVSQQTKVERNVECLNHTSFLNVTADWVKQIK